MSCGRLGEQVTDCENQAMIRRRVIVTGRVQGVFFRQGCHREAVAVGVAGWIHNNQDGTVEAALEGAPDAVERIVSWMRVGPSRAVVTGVKIIEETPLGEHTFMIR
jgi:acylphosphatase